MSQQRCGRFYISWCLNKPRRKGTDLETGQSQALEIMPNFMIFSCLQASILIFLFILFYLLVIYGA